MGPARGAGVPVMPRLGILLGGLRLQKGLKGDWLRLRCLDKDRRVAAARPFDSVKQEAGVMSG
jgi:hypothetical protein